MDISSRFSLVDFLAYFFPGIFDALGIYFILLLTPLDQTLLAPKVDLALGILLLAVSYVVGVILSGFTEIWIQFLRRRRNSSRAKSSIPNPELEAYALESFGRLIGNGEKKRLKWTITKFYICRSLVSELMPNTSFHIQRQSSLRQLRMNMIPGVFIWLIAGTGWGIKTIQLDVAGGIWLILVTVILCGLTFFSLIDRMRSNEEREVREVLTAFVAGYWTNIISRKDKEETTVQIESEGEDGLE